MSDERLRELERRWRASGSDDDEAALLAERVRVGELMEANVRLAAALGYPAALRVVGESLQQAVCRNLRDVLSNLEHKDAVRAHLVLLDEMYHELIPAARGEVPTPVHVIGRLARRWLVAPDASLVSAIQCEASQCHSWMIDLQTTARNYWVQYVCLVAFIIGQLIDDRINVVASWGMLHEDMTYADDELFRAVLCRRFVPWIFGYNDPLESWDTEAGSS